MLKLCLASSYFVRTAKSLSRNMLKQIVSICKVCSKYILY
jgi:hypothetical protein